MGLFSMQQLVVIGALLCSNLSVEAVDRSKFRTCSDTGFCKIYREHNALPQVRKQATHACSSSSSL
jgi:hypothetical protein